MQCQHYWNKSSECIDSIISFDSAAFRLVNWLMEAMIHLQVNQTDTVDCEALTVLLADLATVDNSRERASKLFQWLISPVPAKTFFRFLQTGTPRKHFLMIQ